METREGGSPADARVEVRAERPLACEEAVGFVLAQHPALRAARAGTLDDRAARNVLRWVETPEIRVRSDAGTRDRQTRLGFRLPVPVPGVPSARLRVLGAEKRMTDAETEMLMARIAAAVRRDYVRARYARLEWRAREQLAELAERRVRAMGGRAAAGTATSLALQEARLASAETREEAERARSEVQLAEAAVKRWTGQPVPVDAGPCTLPSGFDIAQRLSVHPEVLAARAAAGRAEAEALVASRKEWLWPSFVEFGWVHEPGDHRDGVLVQGGVRIPAASRDAIEKQARERRLRWEVKATEERVRAAIDKALAKFQAAQEAVHRIEARAQDIARARELAARGAMAGADSEEVWDLRRRIAHWERRLNEAHRERDLRGSELRFELGLP